MSTPNSRISLAKKINATSARTGSLQRKKAEAAGGKWPPRFSSWLLLEKKKKPLRQCLTCFSVYFDGHWHRPRFVKAFAGLFKEVASVVPEECPACALERAAHGPIGAMGEVKIPLLPSAIASLVLQTIRNVGKAATKRDPEERVIAIEEVGGGVRVTTTENQLAVKIGKKLQSSFRGGTLKISFSKDDLPIRVRWMAPQA